MSPIPGPGPIVDGIGMLGTPSNPIKGIGHPIEDGHTGHPWVRNTAVHSMWCGPKYSKKWRLNPFPGTNVTVCVLEGREPSWFHRWTTHWILGFEWERLTPKD